MNLSCTTACRAARQSIGLEELNCTVLQAYRLKTGRIEQLGSQEKRDAAHHAASIIHGLGSTAEVLMGPEAKVTFQLTVTMLRW